MSVTPGPWAMPSSMRNGRSAAVPGSKTVSMWPMSSDARRRRPCRGTSPTTVSPKRPVGSGRTSTSAPELRQEAGRPATDLVDALGRVRAAVDVHEALEVGEVAGQVRGDGRAERVELEIGGRSGRLGRHRGQSTRPLRLLSCRDRAPGRDPPAGGTQRLPARAGGQAGGRGRSAADVVRPARSRAATRSSGSAPRSRPRDWPDPIAAIVAWIRRLRADHDEGRGGLAVHRSSDPGHWIVTFPWTGEERARILTEAALALAERDVSPSRTARLTGAQERLLARWIERIAARRHHATAVDPRRGPTRAGRLDLRARTASRPSPGSSPTSCCGPAGASGRRPRTACSSTSGWSSPGDWTGPGGAQQILARSRHRCRRPRDRPRRDRPARHGLRVERRVSVLTNVSSDHLDLQGIHTLPELAEVKSTICRDHEAGRAGSCSTATTRSWPRSAGGSAATSRTSRLASDALPGRSSAGTSPAAVARTSSRDGWLTELEGDRASRIVEIARVPITIGGLARHNVANALAAAGGARGWARRSTQVARRPGRLRARRPSARRAGSTCSALGARRRDRRLRPQRGRRRRRSSTSPRGSPRGGGRPGGADHGDHRHGRRPAGRHAARDRPDRGAAGPAGRDQGDPASYLRGRTRESVVGELLAGVKAGGGVVADVPVYESETAALRAELNGAAGRTAATAGAPTLRASSC